MKKIYCDGNLKRFCWVIKGEKPVVEEAPFGKITTNNEAEYLAILWALRAEGDRFGDIEILSDSQLVVYQLTWKYKIREPRLQELAKLVRMVVTQKGLNVKFTWLPREENLAGKVLG